jgi:hypothetical protein
MTTNEEHLSMFELDLYFATQASDPRIEEHVASCGRCSAYLSELDALQASPPLPAMPGAPAQARSRPTRQRASRLTLAAGLAVLGAAIALLVMSGEGEPPAVAVKGSPAVQVLVRRGEETRTWDGSRPVQPGDALGLRVACEEFRHVAVAVASGQARGRWSHLSQGVCPAAGGALPLTLVVDDEPGSERLAVVFSRSRLDPLALDEAIEARRLDTDAWVTRFELAKDVSR